MRDQRAFFDLGLFRWTRWPVCIEGDFKGQPPWDDLVASVEDRRLLARARDWPDPPLAGTHDAPDWLQHGGVLVIDDEAAQSAISKGGTPRVGSYDAYREIEQARTPLYRQFAHMDLGHEGAIRSFVRKWGLPLQVDRDGRASCPVLVFQYHSRLLLLALAVLTEIRAGERDPYRPGAALPRLSRFWWLYGVGSARHEDATAFELAMTRHLMQHEDLESPGINTALLQAGTLVQRIFHTQLSASDPWRIVQDGSGESGPRFRYDQQSSGCRPVVQLEVGTNGRVAVGPGWTCGSLLQRIWLEAYKDLQDAVVTQCACGCGKWQWLTGNRRDKFLDRGQRIWAKGHRSRVRNAELRRTMTPKQREKYLAAAGERARAARRKRKVEK